jgi:hypothetical protein
VHYKFILFSLQPLMPDVLCATNRGNQRHHMGLLHKLSQTSVPVLRPHCKDTHTDYFQPLQTTHTSCPSHLCTHSTAQLSLLQCVRPSQCANNHITHALQQTSAALQPTYWLPMSPRAVATKPILHHDCSIRQQVHTKKKKLAQHLATTTTSATACWTPTVAVQATW